MISDLGERHTTLDEFRRDLHVEALGRNKSSKDFTNRDLDRVFAQLDQLDLLANPIANLTRETDQPRKRLAYVIDRMGLPDAYISSIARDKFATSDWRRESEPNLKQLLITLQARLRTNKQLVPPR
jgi:hypothetical protein